MIAREIVDEILQRTDIVALISQYVTLHRAGSNYSGLCPFHSEKTPSFTVFTASNSFYCFGCGAGGDAITFLRKMENMEYEDALARLAKQAGVRLPESTQVHEGRKYSRERLFQMNRDAARFFHASLHENTEEAHAAYRYLHEKRALSDATITHFGLGYAPASFGALTDHMRRKGYSAEELTVGFLCGRSEKSGNLYDSFRNRVMFPIIDTAGNIVAFGGRVMDDSQPKYKNSSDTPVFKKSKNLFALNFARNSCAEQMILCEGYMDVIAMHAAGFTNAVATLGTALTEDQARMMARYTKKVIIAYDMDEAGRRAADRATRMLGDVGLEVRLLTISGAKDPDEFIKTFGADKLRKKLEGSMSKFEYNFGRVLSKYDLTDPQEKIKALADMCALIATFYSRAERDVYIGETAKRLEVDPNAVRGDVERLIGRAAREYRKQEKQKVYQTAAGFADRVNPDFVKAPAVARAEETVLGLLLVREDNLAAAMKPPLSLTDKDFFTEFGKKVFAYLRDSVGQENTPPPDAVFTPDEVGRMTRMRVQRMQLQENGETVLRQSVDTLRTLLLEEQAQSGGMTRDALSALIDRRKNEAAPK